MLLRKSLFAFALICTACGSGVYWWQDRTTTPAAAAAAQYKTPQETDVYVRFDMEAYDLIKDHYYQAASDSQLSQLFQLSLSKAASTSSEPLASQDRAGVAQMLAQAFTGLSNDQKKQLALQTITVALYNLAPTGRSNILSSQAQTDLQNTVNNVKPQDDVYADLGVPKTATPEEVQQAYATKSAALAATTSESGKAALAQLQKASATLSNPVNKQIYDSSGAQASVFSRIINPQTLYLDISTVAPTTIQELAAALDTASSTKSLTNLIIDVRGNIGGDLDFASQFLALFFGPNQYAYDLFHQGNLEVQRTAPIAQSPEITRFKQIAVLTDEMTQSTAEISASALKHDHLAYTVGTTTRGWGSVEQIIPMQTVIDPSETYALELVEYLTVRYDNLPIEGNGVAPDVNLSDPNWKSKLSNYFYTPSMISALKTVAAEPPLQK